MKKMLTGIVAGVMAASFIGIAGNFMMNPAKAAERPKAVAQEAGESLRIAYLVYDSNAFWDSVVEGAKGAQTYLKKYNTTVDIISLGKNFSIDTFNEEMDAAVSMGYDGIVVVPQMDGTEEAINDAVESDVPVITFNGEGNIPGKRLFLYAQNAYNAGKKAGELIVKATGGSGKIAVITGYKSAAQHEQRKNGALDYIKKNAPGIRVVKEFENHDKKEIAYSQTEQLLKANPDVKVIYVTAGGPTGAAKYIQNAGLTGKVHVVAYDAIPSNLEFVKSGQIYGLVDQDPYGQGFDTCVLMHNYLVSGQKPAGTFVEIQSPVVTKSNLSQYLK